MEPTEVQLDPETELLLGLATSNENIELPDAQLRSMVEAVIYVTDEPLSADQIATALQQPAARIGQVLEELTAEYNKPEHGLTIREVAGGYKMSTKPEHHEAIRAFVKNLKPPLKLSLASLETLALIAYKQPITAPEVMEVRGVQGAGVIKTLIDRKLIATAGRKTVLGKPILYKTTKEFLVQFGLKDLSELPTLKEFEELGRLSMGDEEMPPETPPPETPPLETQSDTPRIEPPALVELSTRAETPADEVAVEQVEPSPVTE
jgi:segregation and condensation protein B